MGNKIKRRLFSLKTTRCIHIMCDRIFTFFLRCTLLFAVVFPLPNPHLPSCFLLLSVQRQRFSEVVCRFQVQIIFPGGLFYFVIKGGIIFVLFSEGENLPSETLGTLSHGHSILFSSFLF
ncbi:Uncharacterized protein APZ42_029092 [Daphnia magna]|uniref:Uncharacterized protein n=1 Tax=Daphnia magna TaxID=35525 RepID=A0A0P6A651_9CRUS|nr:Uncharacterized protein APZ42_029092 [Daphnia magna]